MNQIKTFHFFWFIFSNKNKTMTKHEILNKHYVEVYYVEDYKVAVVIWKGTEIKSQEYKNTFHSIFDFCKKGYKLVNYFSDTREQGTISLEDRKWFEDYVLTEARKFGLKRGASVIPGNVFKRHYMNMILGISKFYKIDMKLFDNKDAAQKWLLSFEDYN